MKYETGNATRGASVQVGEVEVAVGVAGGVGTTEVEAEVEAGGAETLATAG